MVKATIEPLKRTTASHGFTLQKGENLSKNCIAQQAPFCTVISSSTNAFTAADLDGVHCPVP
jgi:hypothetical protein